MSELKDNIIRLLVFVAGVILCSYIISLFQKNKSLPDNTEIIKSKDEQIKSEKEKTAIYREWKDDMVKLVEVKDSLLQIKQKTIITRYEKVPASVNAYTDAELTSAILERYNH